MMFAVAIQVPLVNGKPNLGLTAQQQQQIDITRDGGIVFISWRDERVAALRSLGTPAGGDPVFAGVMEARLFQAIRDNLDDVKIARLRFIWANQPTRKTWLLANGVSEVGGVPVIPHVIAGELGGRDGDVADPLAS